MAVFGACLVIGSVLVLQSPKAAIKVGGLDPIFYFANAHALLFRQSFDLRSELAVVKIPDYNAIYPGYHGAHGLPGSPWALGYSILAIPFLTAGTLADGIRGAPMDGYGPMAMLFFLSANSVFVAVGLYLTMKFLVKMGTRPWTACLIAMAMWFSTTLIYYTLAPLSHAATFLMAAAFLVTWMYVRGSRRMGFWVLFGLCGGLMSICRWQDVVFILGVLLVELISRRFSLRPWLFFAAGFCVFWLIQIAQWKVVYDKWITQPYGRGFSEFPPQHLLDVLFSTNHGWIAWTPVVVFGLVGLALEARRMWPWLLVIALEVFVVGSLVVYWYGAEAFGSRMLTSTVPLIALGIAILFRKVARWGRIALIAGVGLCAVYTTLFAAQYSFKTIPHEGALSADQMFWDKVELLKDPVTYLEVASQRKSLLPD